eukprot:TRINITY_DN7585_c0_g1_i2.p1 TRINITY_DN7585_c0_g1~~TRINITY_DN7585_c0_g1_i2.p1  ORF type:complete len:491 (+),score=185.01 TRINITY_DN7585_c0_g1_i2:433-1905(+)
MAFKSDHSNERKEWLVNPPSEGVDHTKKELEISEFVQKELILFSHANNLRCIPSAIDGLKPGQRKILFASFLRNLRDETKVSQLAGFVSERTAYHHGEVSLHGTIVHMAQEFVGANNLPLFYPSGQFGSRLSGGKDAASARYLFTRLCSITRKIFPEVDDGLLRYLEDDGISVQPEYYVPTIPMILVNGCEGLGTGWSTFVPMYNPIDIIDNLKLKIMGNPMNPMKPYFHGFKGIVEEKSQGTFVTTGIAEKTDPGTVVISELPVYRWVDDFKKHLDLLIKKPGKGTALVKSFNMNFTEKGSAEFILKLGKAQMEVAENTGFSKQFKLTSTFSLNNMVLFDSHGKIRKYSDPNEVIHEFFEIRMALYKKRKDVLLKQLQVETAKISNRARFCEMVASGKLKLGNVARDAVISELRKLGFEEFESNFDYLLNTPIWNTTLERVEKLLKERDQKAQELGDLKTLEPSKMWLNELESLRKDIVALYKTSSSAS